MLITLFEGVVCNKLWVFVPFSIHIKRVHFTSSSFSRSFLHRWCGAPGVFLPSGILYASAASVSVQRGRESPTQQMLKDLKQDLVVFKSPKDVFLFVCFS